MSVDAEISGELRLIQLSLFRKPDFLVDLESVLEYVLGVALIQSTPEANNIVFGDILLVHF